MVCSQKCLSRGPLFSARGGSGPQQVRSGLQEAIRGLRQDASQIQLGRTGTGSGLSAAACQSEQVSSYQREWCVCQGWVWEWVFSAITVCASYVFCLYCTLYCLLCMSVWVYPLTHTHTVYRSNVRSVTVGKLHARSLGKCSPIHRNQWRIELTIT